MPSPSLQRGLLVVAHLARHGHASFSELSRLLEVAPGITDRLLKELIAGGWVERRAEGGYRLGLRASSLAPSSDPRAELIAQAQPLLDELAAATRCTALLVGCEGRSLQVLAKQTHEDSLTMQPVGSLRSDFLPYTWGWILLERLPPRQRRTQVEQAEPALQALHRRGLDDLARSGFCRQLTPGRRRLAAPLRDANGRAQAAIGLGGSETVLTARSAPALGQELLLRCAELERRLGWRAAGEDAA